MKRSRCAAGHKAMWHADWDGLPPEAFLVQRRSPAARPARAAVHRDTDVGQERGRPHGGLGEEASAFAEGAAVAVGAFDAHMGAVGAQIKPYTFLCKVMGTSTCDILMAPMHAMQGKLVPRGYLRPGRRLGDARHGRAGAGQSAFGDVYAWFKDLLSWPLPRVRERPAARRGPGACAARKGIEGRRPGPAWRSKRPRWTRLVHGGCPGLAERQAHAVCRPDAERRDRGADPGYNGPKIFRALVEATAFGSRAIVEQFRKEGVAINAVIAQGGMTARAPLSCR